VTMHRRPLGGGRTLAAVGGVLIIVGSVLPWWRVGGSSGIPQAGGNAFEGSGIIVFLVGVATLALVALPYAVGDRPTGIDRPMSFALLAVVGWLGLGWRVIDLLLSGAFTFSEPVQVFTNGPGLWIAGLGLAVLSRAVYRMTREPIYR
jgi:hypothetical protein